MVVYRILTFEDQYPFVLQNAEPLANASRIVSYQFLVFSVS